ncbi:MAG: hypothetical protein KDB03_10485 [Planctomycetales bacterium]|nr:hypothetical protein [Planctomycetales bacterium]
MKELKISARKFAEWSGGGQLRSLILHSDQILLWGGVNPVNGPRSHFQAVAVSLDSRTATQNWNVVVEKSMPFVHAAIHDESLLLVIPHNFTRSFTGYLEYDIRTGIQKSQHKFDEVILSCLSVDKQLYLGTAFNGVYRVFQRKNGVDTEFAAAIDSRYQLETIRTVGNNILVLSEFDRTLSKLVYCHSAFTSDGQSLWKIESPYRQFVSTESKLIFWDEESPALQVYDIDSAQNTAVMELASPPLESPVVIGAFGIAYACSDCSIRIRSWSGGEWVIYKQLSSGTIALGYDSHRNVLFAAFSGNFRDTTTNLVMLEIQGI